MTKRKITDIGSLLSVLDKHTASRFLVLEEKGGKEEFFEPVVPFPLKEEAGMQVAHGHSNKDYQLQDLPGFLPGFKKHLNRCWQKDVKTNVSEVRLRTIEGQDTVLLVLCD